MDAVVGLAEQLGQASLAVQEWRVAQVVALMLDQVEREQHCIMVAPAAVQRVEIRKSVIPAGLSGSFAN